MKKKVLATLLTAAMLATTLVGCGGGAADGGAAPAGDGAAAEAPAAAGDDGAADDGGAAPAADEAAAEEEIPTSTFGDPNGTHLEMWTFVEIHGQHYGNMVEKWNEQNPDRPIEITCTTYPYGDMHTKLLTSLTAGTGAPDICDVEIGQFPNVVAGLDTWLVPQNDMAAPYLDTMVKARMDVYAGSDGNYYGIPYHVGAFVMYYNVAAMSEAMGISQDDVIAKIDGVVTWDDWASLGQEYLDALGNPDDKHWTQVDTAGVDWQWIAMAEHGDDWTGGFDNPADVRLDSVKKMCEMEQGWLESGLAMVSPDGHIDLEAGFQNILDHNIASFPKAMWFMSRFTNYMPEESGNWYIAKCPVFQAGQPCSVGVGGTGTVVTQQAVDKDLASEFLCWAKMSADGEQLIWDNLGFDVCNTALWNDDAFAHDDNNQYNAFFINYPYDVLYSIKDDIGKIYSVAISPIINEQMCNVTLNDMFENGVPVDDALQAAQDVIDLEQ